jgi:homoserine O-acetyltransferase
MKFLECLCLAGLLAGVPALSETSSVPVVEHDFVTKDFRFSTGESLPILRLHYRTIGVPHRNRAGQIDNAVMILHGTGGDGTKFLGPRFAGVLFDANQPLDTSRYFVILPDAVGFGGSSKPSDGLHARFPHYTFDDMIEADRRLLHDGLGVDHLRLLMGTSMGCMEVFAWAEKYPDTLSAVMPLACSPLQLSGMNQIWRKSMVEGIKADPAWQGGEYKAEPVNGVRLAISVMMIATAGVWDMQRDYPTRAKANDYVARRLGDLAQVDANDLMYQIDSSRDYDPEPGLERIAMPLMWVNSADDMINLPGSPMLDAAAKRMPNAKFYLVPMSPRTHGHATHSLADTWLPQLQDLLQRSGG